MIKLNPCPFCGGKAEEDTFGINTFISCKNCGATGPIRQFKRGAEDGDVRREPAKRWNMRISSVGAEDGLRKCPFCGGYALGKGIMENLGVVQCTHCGATGPRTIPGDRQHLPWKTNEEYLLEVFEAWNRRVNDGSD